MPRIHFKTKAQIMEHPQARLIPETMRRWDLFMGETLPLFLFDFMQLSNEELMANLGEVKQRDVNSRLTWLALAVSHPTLTHDQLYNMSLQLGITHRSLYINACRLGNISFLKFILSKFSRNDQIICIASDSDHFSLSPAAADPRCLSTLKFILEKKLELNGDSSLTDLSFSYAVQIAAKKGNVLGLKYLLSKANRAQIEKLTQNPGSEFREAAQSGNLSVLKYLFNRFPQWAENKDFMNALFRSAASYGHLHLVEYIREKSRPHDPLKNIDRDTLSHILDGVMTHLDGVMTHSGVPLLDYLRKTGQLTIKIINPANWFRFGNTQLIKYLIDEQLVSLDNNSYVTLWTEVLERVPLERIKYLMNEHPEFLENLTNEQFKKIFSEGANDIPTLEHLIALRPSVLNDDISFQKAFYQAASRNDLPVMKYLVSKRPNILNIAYTDYHNVLLDVASAGRLSILQYLIDKVPPKRAIINSAFDLAARNCELDVINYLLSFTVGLTHAEAHYGEFKDYVYPYINRLLTHLHEQKTKFEQEHPNTVFNEVNPEQAKIYLCCLRNLIRRNDPALLNEIIFLLDIPAVKDMAHTSVAPDQPNELLRLALSTSNEGAARLLLNIPAVHALAEQNAFYRDEAQGQFNLENLARDRESSMLALSPGEQKRMKRVEDFYSAEMKAKGVPALMKELKTTLTARYAKNPAFIMQMKDGKEQRLDLPLQWADFQKLKLSDAEQELALSAYYKHKDHGAFRYLSKPNQWMHAHASYVNVNPKNTKERWSTFNEYEPLIALLYLAAKDENKDMVMDGYTAETRFDQFVDELHHINRAHNWDQKRVKNNKEEEYDDGEGDRPSCFSGVKRRLFQSVVGHPLLNLVTLQTIKMELRDFVRNHFKEAIKKGNAELISKGLKTYYEELELTEPLKQLDISTKQQQEFIKSLEVKYKEQFTDDPAFTQYLEKQFILKEGDAHALSFNHFKWTQFLPGWVEAVPVVAQEPVAVAAPAVIPVPVPTPAAATPQDLSRPIILPEPTKAKKPTPPAPTPINVSLPKAEFLALLGTLETKQKDYLCNYIDADIEADVMLLSLKNAADSFYDHPMTEESFKEFKNSCDEALHPDRRSSLGEHRNHFGAFFTAIKNFLAALKQAIFNEPGEKLRFWDTRTQTEVMVDQLDEDIQRVNPLDKKN